MGDMTVPEAIQELSKACANESSRLLIANSELARLRDGVRDAVNQLRAEHRDMSGVNFCVTCDIGMPCLSAQVADRLEALIGGKP